ncbi:heat-shock protein [Striga asiatica]|uniref:Heat-shock protein n=1 Tax=Striga asiatica TaxID=4170 RepID=A0A5A7PQK4_STRAF|nr:heat-shock protein [Striga asiatica]
MAASLFLNRPPFLNRLKLINSHLGGSLHPTASFLSTKHISPTVQFPPLTASRPDTYRCYFIPGVGPDTSSDDDVGEGFPIFISLFDGGTSLLSAASCFPFSISLPSFLPLFIFSSLYEWGEPVDINGYGAKFKLDYDGLHMNVFLPGVKRENVKVSVNHGKLCIEGTKKDFEEQKEETKMKYESDEIPEDLYNTDEMTANMKDGVLKVFIPRINRAIKWYMFK